MDRPGSPSVETFAQEEDRRERPSFETLEETWKGKKKGEAAGERLPPLVCVFGSFAYRLTPRTAWKLKRSPSRKTTAVTSSPGLCSRRT
jgi:hypothetical protein